MKLVRTSIKFVSLVKTEVFETCFSLMKQEEMERKHPLPKDIS